MGALLKCIDIFFHQVAGRVVLCGDPQRSLDVREMDQRSDDLSDSMTMGFASFVELDSLVASELEESFIVDLRWGCIKLGYLIGPWYLYWILVNVTRIKRGT